MAYISACQRRNESQPVSQAQPLNARQREFLRLYVGRNSRYRGNATACYKKAYECSDDRVAQACGSRLTRENVHIKAAIEAAKQKALDNLGIDATFVLRESLRLYDRAMGDEAVEVDVIDTKKQADGSTVHVVRVVEQRDHNPAIARQALELIGRHTSVQAFQDNVEHTHTHRLEQALAKRHQQIEAAAGARPAIEGRSQRLAHGDQGQGASPAGVGAPKEGASGAGSRSAPPPPAEKTTAERARATGK